MRSEQIWDIIFPGKSKMTKFRAVFLQKCNELMKIGEIRDSFGTPLVKNCRKIRDMSS